MRVRGSLFLLLCQLNGGGSGGEKYVRGGRSIRRARRKQRRDGKQQHDGLDEQQHESHRGKRAQREGGV